MAHDDGSDQTGSSHNPNNGPGAAHSLLKSFEFTDNAFGKLADQVTATITFAAPVDEVDADDDDSDAEDVHATLLVRTLSGTDLTIQQRNSDDTAWESQGDLEIISVTAGGSYDTTTKTDTSFTIVIRVGNNVTLTDRTFRVTVDNVFPAATANTDDDVTDLTALGKKDTENNLAILYSDVTVPTVTVDDIGNRSPDDVSADQWRDPFELRVTVTDAGSGFTPSASNPTVVETDKAGKALATADQNVDIGPFIQDRNSDYIARITPTVATTEKTAIYFKVTATDNAGNSTDQMLGTNLAQGLSPRSLEPEFKAPGKNLPIAVCVGDALPTYPTLDANGMETAVILPLADHDESISVKYNFEDTLPAGLTLRTIDAQTRVIEGTPTVAGTGTYTWRVADTLDSSNSDTTEISITVKALQVPETPTGLTARKLDSADTNMTTKDRVELTWTQPEDKSGYDDCIPFPEDYVVYQTVKNILTGEFGTEVTYDSSTSAHDSKFTRDTEDVATHFTVKLTTPGTYKFKIKAKNSVGVSKDKSDFATWTLSHHDPVTKTDSMVELDYVVVADPPGAPTDLDGAVDQDGDKVTLDWLAPAVHGGAEIGELHGGKMFGGYVVYQTRDADDTVVRYPAQGYLTTDGAKTTSKIVPTRLRVWLQVSMCTVLQQRISRVKADKVSLRNDSRLSRSLQRTQRTQLLQLR